MKTAKNHTLKMRFIFSVFFAFIFYSTDFASVTVQCDNKNYAGKKLDFYAFTDPVSSESKLVFSLHIDQNGKSSQNVELQNIQFVFCDFGIYRGLLFLEPDQNTVLKLPPVREKSFADQKNPYFKPVTFWFETENARQLNNQVAKFTAQLNQVTDQYFDPLYFRQSKPYLDSLKIRIDKEFGSVKNEHFVLIKQLALKQVEVDAFRLKPESYTTVFNNIKPVYWQFPAFTDLFEKAFSGLLSFDAKTVGGDNLKKAVNQGNMQALLDHLKKRYKVTGEMADLVLLKILHDAWYSGDFSKTSIQQMLKATRFTGHQTPVIRETAKNISEKILFLQSGSLAPFICLKNLEEQKTCTNTTKGKYKYILFADTEMAVSREHLKYLSAIEQKFQKNLEIFIVLRKTELAGVKKFFAENQVPGVKLIDENGEFSALYKIRSYPQCFLLDENHMVKLAPAKAPLDGFEQQFSLLLQNDKIENLRKQGK